MGILNQLYGHSLGLLTDLYQLTMAYGYWKVGMREKEAAFNLSFRKCPFGGAFALACGLEYAIDYLDGFRIDDSDLTYLSELKGNDGERLFEEEFLNCLGELSLTCEVDAIPEGTVVFPHEPLVRVSGPLIQCQIVETPLLNLVNFQTLIATKAARICMATGGDPVLEFGLRRAQGIDGGLAASRAAHIGGCAATSNVLAGKLFGIPVKGTHAHSWVMCFDNEIDSFEAYAQALPNNCVFLVDTYSTLEGVRNAVKVGETLRARGHEMVGVRLDSGDLAPLSIRAREILDQAGFPGARIIASNDLDERLIRDLKEQGATISIWGVGTKLASAYDQPALGGVYKLAAIREPGQEWQYRIKLSEEAGKSSIPGIVQVRRFSAGPRFFADMMYDARPDGCPGRRMVDPGPPHTEVEIPEGMPHDDLLIPVLRRGETVGNCPEIGAIRERALRQLAQLPEEVKRLDRPETYPVGLEKGLYEMKEELAEKARKTGREA